MTEGEQMFIYSRYINHPYCNRFERKLTQIINYLAKHNYSCATIYHAQVRIISELLFIEDGIKYFKNENNRCRRDASEFAKHKTTENGILGKVDKEYLKSLYDEAEYYSASIDFLQFCRWMFRYIGDGIAWRVYGYDRQIISAFGMKEKVPFISNPEGIENELNFFKGLRRLGKSWLPVMHDITNCLRTSDFSVFKNGKLIQVIELKIRRGKGGKNENGKVIFHDARGKRQIEHLETVQKFLVDGDPKLLMPNLPNSGKTIYSRSIEYHHYSTIVEGIIQARKIGYSNLLVEQCLIYQITYNKIQTSLELTEIAMEKASQEFPEFFTSLFTFRSISPRFNEYHLQLPITAMDLDPRDISEILLGKVSIVVLLNYELFIAQCRKQGVDIYFAIQDEMTQIWINNNPSIQVSDGIWDRILLEGLTIDSFCNLAKDVINESKLMVSI